MPVLIFRPHSTPATFGGAPSRGRGEGSSPLPLARPVGEGEGAVGKGRFFVPKQKDGMESRF